MVFMSAEERYAYWTELRPYLEASVAIFFAGLAAGLIILARFPDIADRFQSSLVGFVKIFHGLPPLQLAGAIFLNNALKTLAAIALGSLFGVIPAIYLFANGAALGIVFTLSAQRRGLWISLLSIAPHGLVELPAVFLGTGIGLMLGAHAIKSIFQRTPMSLRSELGRGMKFFSTVIAPLLLIAALIEAFLTSALVAPR